MTRTATGSRRTSRATTSARAATSCPGARARLPADARTVRHRTAQREEEPEARERFTLRPPAAHGPGANLRWRGYRRLSGCERPETPRGAPSPARGRGRAARSLDRRGDPLAARADRARAPGRVGGAPESACSRREPGASAPRASSRARPVRRQHAGAGAALRGEVAPPGGSPNGSSGGRGAWRGARATPPSPRTRCSRG